MFSLASAIGIDGREMDRFHPIRIGDECHQTNKSEKSPKRPFSMSAKVTPTKDTVANKFAYIFLIIRLQFQFIFDVTS
jgi:hypothetical protein